MRDSILKISIETLIITHNPRNTKTEDIITESRSKDIKKALESYEIVKCKGQPRFRKRTIYQCKLPTADSSWDFIFD